MNNDTSMCHGCRNLESEQMRHPNLLLAEVTATEIAGDVTGVAVHICSACGARWQFTEFSEWRFARVQ